MDANTKNNQEEPVSGQVSEQPFERPDIRKIKPAKIDIGELCLRRNPQEDLDRLVESIETLGLLQFPVVRQKPDGRYELVCGLRRYLTHKKNDKETILCRVMDVDPLEAALIALAENSQGGRKAAHPVLEAEAMRKIIDSRRWSEAELAQRIGYTQSGVAEQLGTARLPKYILEKIDNRPESCFRYYHAVELSKVELNRFYREAEVEALFNKTITVGVSSAELRKLVQLINDGHYDRLPDPIKTFLFTNKYMTSAMARLFLYPEEIIEPDDGDAELLRKTASGLDKKERQDFIEKAIIEKEWSKETAKKELLKLIKQRSGVLQPAPAKKCQADQKPMSAAQQLHFDISTLLSKMQTQRYQMSCFVESDSGDIVKLRNAGALLIRQLRSFLRALPKATNADKSNTKNSLSGAKL